MVILAKFGQNPSKYVAAVANLRAARRRRRRKKKKERVVRQDLHVTKLRVGKERTVRQDLHVTKLRVGKEEERTGSKTRPTRNQVTCR